MNIVKFLNIPQLKYIFFTRLGPSKDNIKNLSQDTSGKLRYEAI